MEATYEAKPSPQPKYRPEPTPAQQATLDAMKAGITGGALEVPMSNGGSLQHVADKGPAPTDERGTLPGVPPTRGYRPKNLPEKPTALTDRMLREAAWQSVRAQARGVITVWKHLGWCLACTWRLWRNDYDKGPHFG